MWKQKKTLKKCLRIQLEYLPNLHPNVADTYTNISNVYSEGMLDFWCALSFSQKAFQIRHLALPSNHPLLAQAHFNLAVDLMALRRFEKAWTHANQAVEIVHCFRLPRNHSEVRKYEDLLQLLFQDIAK